MASDSTHLPASKAIRDFLTAAFSDEELTTLCFDHFPEVYNSFSTGLTKGQKIQLLIEYGVRRAEWSALISALQNNRPRQFAAFFETSSISEQQGSSNLSTSAREADVSGGLNFIAGVHQKIFAIDAHQIAVGHFEFQYGDVHLQVPRQATAFGQLVEQTAERPAQTRSWRACPHPIDDRYSINRNRRL